MLDLNIPKLFLGGPGIINSKRAYFVGVKTNTEILYCEGQGEEEIYAFLSNTLQQKNIPEWDMSIYDRNEKSLCFESYKIDLHEYINRQLKSPDYPYPAITYSTLSHIGCLYRAKCGGCTFCGIPHHFYHIVDGEIFWQDFKNFRHFCLENFMINPSQIKSIKDWGDSINTQILEELLKKRPDDCKDVQYNCYISCRDITVENLNLLKAMNCYSVYIGIDGTSTISLKSLKKGYDSSYIYSKLELLNNYPFKIEIGLIIGNEAETIETLNNIVIFARFLKKKFSDKVIVIQGNVLIPMPGSEIYSKLKRQVKNDEQDNLIDPLECLSVEQRIRLWLKYNSSVTYEDCVRVQHEIEKISPRKHSYVE